MYNAVRRLTPLECERLQGFPDNWTLIGEPEEVEVKDYEIRYDAEGNETEKIQTGTHIEAQYFWYDENGKKHRCSDSDRYKALGNSIALPFWYQLLGNISRELDESDDELGTEGPYTIGSLFDGISGFPVCWYMYHGKDACKWSSEIEPFCIALVRQHFGDEETGAEGDIDNYYKEGETI